MKPDLSLKNISIFRFWSGMVVYLSYSYIVFNFFILFGLFTVACRYITRNFYSLLYETSYEEYKFYVFFIAFYSICFSLSLLVSYWYNKPAYTPKQKRERRFISYERNAFVASFVQWLFRLSILLLIFYYTSLARCLELFTTYKIVFVFMALVVFLDLWIGFRRVYKVRLRNILYSFLGVTILALIFTFFQPFNDKQMLKFINKGSQFGNIDIAQVNDKYLLGRDRRYNKKLFIDRDFKIYNEESKQITFDSFDEYFIDEFYINSWPLNSVDLFVDRNISYVNFEKLKRELLLSERDYVNIIVNPLEFSCDKFSNNIKIALLPDKYSFVFVSDSNLNPRVPPPPEIEDIILFDSSLVYINLVESSFSYNDKHFEIDDLEKQLIQEKFQDKTFVIQYNKESSFQEYITSFSQISNTVYANRDSFLLKHTGFNFLDLREEIHFTYEEKQKNENYKILYKMSKEIYPIRIIEKEIK